MAAMRRAGRLTEREGVGLRARVEEGDLERVLGDRTALADELIQPRLGDRARAVVGDVVPRVAGRPSRPPPRGPRPGAPPQPRTPTRAAPPGPAGATTGGTAWAEKRPGTPPPG